MPVVIQRRGVEFQELAAVVTELHLLQQFIGDREQCLLHTSMIYRYRYMVLHHVKNKQKIQTVRITGDAAASRLFSQRPKHKDNLGFGISQALGVLK